MKKSIVGGLAIGIALLTVLLASGCASQRVKCDRHLVPINVPHGKREALK
jgi:hypothetical protein